MDRTCVTEYAGIWGWRKDDETDQMMLRKEKYWL